MKLRSYLLFILTFVLFSTVAGKHVHADDGSYGQYGQYPTASQSILIDKMVAHDVASKGATLSSEYVDNLSVSDYHFKPGQQVYFKLKIKNTSDAKLTDVTVVDELPDYVTFVDGDGSYNKDANSVTIKAGDIGANEEKTYYITAKTQTQDELPADKGIICMTNKATVSSDQNASDSDTAQFCVEKEVIGVQNVPATGPELWILLTAAEAVAFTVGMKLRNLQ